MHRVPSRLLRRAGLVGAGALASGAVALASGGAGTPEYRLPGARVEAIRPTGVGLPKLELGSYGAAELPDLLRRYHDSGRYDRDLRAVGDRARRYLVERVRERRRAPGADPRPALVLDIDETTLSSYEQLEAAGFAGTAGALAASIVAARAPAIAPTLALYRAARRERVAVFFITGRPEGFRAQTAANLRRAGFRRWAGLTLQPPGSTSTAAYKSGARERIERRGFRILVNVGDQDSDLVGGHAERAFKLANPFYFSAP
jgi:acid phosphatase